MSVPTSSYYGQGLYGAGTYGGRGRPPPVSVIVPEPDRAPRPPVHLFGIGPWADNVTWRAYPNKGLVPTNEAPSLPLVAVDGVTAASVTLRRKDAAEARLEIDQARGTALVVEEMVTDLWWRRRCLDGDDNESIGRFNCDSVDITADGDRLRTAATFVDWRGYLDGRIVTDPAQEVDFAPGITRVNDLMRRILPDDAGLDLSAIDEVDLGMLTQGMNWKIGASVTETMKTLEASSPPFDWAIERGEGFADRPTLRLWPGARGADKGVVLHDTGVGFSPIASWRRRTNRQDYANQIVFSGSTGSQIAGVDTVEVPTGPRDGYLSDNNLIKQSYVLQAAQRAVAERSVRKAAWDITLIPGWWTSREHIDLGDWVRVVIRLGNDVLDERAQVEELALEIAADGMEHVTLSLGWGKPSTNPASRRSTGGQVASRLKALARTDYVPSTVEV